MEQALKQRLVGAAVIIAVGVIVIPVLLDGAGERQLRKMPDAPTPAFQSRPGMVDEEKIIHSTNKNTAQIVLTLPDAENNSAEDSTEKAKPDTTLSQAVSPPAPKNKQPDKPKATSSNAPKPAATATIKAQPKDTPVAAKSTPSVAKQRTLNTPKSGVWVVQVGSFTDAKKAFQLRDSLRKKNYKTFVEKISGRSGQSLYRVRVGPLTNRDKAEVVSGKLKKQGIEGFVTRHP